MERAGRILGKLQIKPVNVAGVEMYHLAPGAWISAVGKKIATHTKAVFLEGTTLIVETEDAVWQSQLRTLERAIVERIGKVLGEDKVKKIDFRVAPPRRAAALAVSPQRISTDDSEQIIDPVMRHVYRTARRKASA